MSLSNAYMLLGSAGSKKKAIGQIEYTTSGTYTFTVPANVYSVSVVCIGAADSGATSSVKNSIFDSTVIAYGNNGKTGGSFSGGDGGGNGGNGGNGASNNFDRVRCGGGGGGCGGYTGTGGNGGNGIPDIFGSNRYANGGLGGNVGIYGEGTSGAGGTTAGIGASSGTNGTGGGGGGAGGGYVNNSGTIFHGATGGYGSAGTSTGFGGGRGGAGISIQDGFGGAGLVYKNNIVVTPGQNISIQVGSGSTGSGGAVRIIWPGDERQFPSTRTADEVE